MFSLERSDSLCLEVYSSPSLVFSINSLLQTNNVLEIMTQHKEAWVRRPRICVISDESTLRAAANFSAGPTSIKRPFPPPPPSTNLHLDSIRLVDAFSVSSV
ncbi:hypothetical protein FRC03_006402 [Tulasnella sp. 419]|nr:hypothetical protein FRC03_006402 [Tulasnella sp. 419]